MDFQEFPKIARFSREIPWAVFLARLALISARTPVERMFEGWLWA